MHQDVIKTRIYCKSGGRLLISLLAILFFPLMICLIYLNIFFYDAMVPDELVEFFTQHIPSLQKLVSPASFTAHSNAQYYGALVWAIFTYVQIPCLFIWIAFLVRLYTFKVSLTNVSINSNTKATRYRDGVIAAVICFVAAGVALWLAIDSTLLVRSKYFGYAFVVFSSAFLFGVSAKLLWASLLIRKHIGR